MVKTTRRVKAFEVKPGSYPLSVTLEGAETIQEYTLHASH